MGYKPKKPPQYLYPVQLLRQILQNRQEQPIPLPAGCVMTVMNLTNRASLGEEGRPRGGPDGNEGGETPSAKRMKNPKIWRSDRTGVVRNQWPVMTRWSYAQKPSSWRCR